MTGARRSGEALGSLGVPQAPARSLRMPRAPAPACAGLACAPWTGARGKAVGLGAVAHSRSRIEAGPRSAFSLTSCAGARMRGLGLRAVDWRAGQGGRSGRGRAFALPDRGGASIRRESGVPQVPARSLCVPQAPARPCGRLACAPCAVAPGAAVGLGAVAHSRSRIEAGPRSAVLPVGARVACPDAWPGAAGRARPPAGSMGHILAGTEAP